MLQLTAQLGYTTEHSRNKAFVIAAALTLDLLLLVLLPKLLAHLL